MARVSGSSGGGGGGYDARRAQAELDARRKASAGGKKKWWRRAPAPGPSGAAAGPQPGVEAGAPVGQPWPGMAMGGARAPLPGAWGRSGMMLPSTSREYGVGSRAPGMALRAGGREWVQPGPVEQGMGQRALGTLGRVAGGLLAPVAAIQGAREFLGESAAGARFKEQVGRAWDKVGAPIEGAQLPEAWGRLQEVREQGAGGRVPGVYPGARPELLTPEQRAEVGERGMAGLGVLGAAWHDVKQAPLVGKPARRVEAGLEMGLAGLMAPAAGVEEQLATGALQRLPGGQTLPPLSPGQHLTEEQKARAAVVAEERGIPVYAAQQLLLLGERQEQPSVRDYVVGRYGEGEQVEGMMRELGLGLGYSSYGAQIAAADRLMAGESLETVGMGRRINTYDPGEEDMQAFSSYVEGIRAREGDAAADAAAQRVVEEGFIPGESDLANELVFQFALDPLNLMDVGAWSRGMQARKAKAAGRVAQAGEAGEAAGATLLAMRYGDEAAQYADDVAEGLKAGMVVGKRRPGGASVLGGGDDMGMLRQVFDKVNPLAPTARAQAEGMTASAFQLVSPAVWDATSADEAAAIVRAMADDPARMMGALGNVPVSGLADEARPVLQAVVEDLDGFKSLKGKFNRERFLAELDDAMLVRGLELTGVSGAEISKYKKFTSGFKGAMSEFYLRTPGYAVRNAMGDLATMAWDGVLSLDGRGAIDDFMARFGPTTRRVRGMAAGAQTAELAGEATNLPGILGQASSKLGSWISAQEEARYTRAYYTALKKSLPRVWKPSVPEDIALLLGGDAARRIEQGLARGLSEKEFLQVIDDAAGGRGLVDVGQWLERPDDLSVGMRLHLEEALAEAGEVGVDGVIDEAIETVRANTARVYAGDPTPPGRNVWSEMEAVQDLREEQGVIEGMGQAMGVEGEEVARAQAALENGLRPGEQAIAEAEMELVGRMAGEFDEDAANLMRSTRADTGRIKMQARGEADVLRAAAWEKYQAARAAGENTGLVWDDYFRQVEGLHRQAQADVVARLQEAGSQWERVRAGEGFEAVMGRPAQSVVDEALEQLRVLAQDVSGRKERLRRLGLESFVDFDQMLDAQRLTVDTAQAEAWRMVGVNPSRDGLDIVMSMQRNVDEMAQAAANEAATARVLMTRRKISVDKYHEITSEVWGKYFSNASQGWDLARWELAQSPMNAAVQQRALGALGWSPEMAALLKPDEVNAVLSVGVKWDPFLGGPEMELAEAMRGTLAEVAGQAGMDLTRSADWTADEWGALAEQARMLKEGAGERASAVGRMAGAAVAEHAEEIVGAPQTVGKGMELAWPQSVDDVARSMGLRPQGMGAEDWAQVGEMAGQRAGQAEDATAAARWVELGEEARARAGIGGGAAVSVQGLGGVGSEEALQRLSQLVDTDLSKVKEPNVHRVSGRVRQAIDYYLDDMEDVDEIFELHEALITWVNDDGDKTFLIQAIEEHPEWAGRVEEVSQEFLRVFSPDYDSVVLFEHPKKTHILFRTSRRAELKPWDSLTSNLEFAFGREIGEAVSSVKLEGTVFAYEVPIESVWTSYLTYPFPDDLLEEGEFLLNAAVGEVRLLGEVGSVEEGLELARRVSPELAGQGRVPPTQYVPSAPGQYDAAGFPVARTRRGRASQRAVVDAAEEMVPEAQRLGRGRATAGFEERQVQLAEQYGDLEEMARARRGMMQSGALAGGDVLDVPAGTVKAVTRKDEGLWVVDFMDDEETPRVLRTYVYDSYADAKAAKKEAASIIADGRQGQAAAVGTSWTAWGTEDVAAADRRAGQMGGNAGAPTMRDAARVVEDMELQALERVREGARVGSREYGVGEISPEAQRRLRQWVQGDMGRQWSEARATGVEMARDAADFALLNYGERVQMDDWLGLAFPYSYWKTRSGRNWALRFMERPGALAKYVRYRDGTERRGMEGGQRARFEGTVGVDAPGLEKWTGQKLYVNPDVMLPWTQILGPSWVDDQGEDGVLGTASAVAQKLGLRPYGFIEWPLQYMNWMGKREDIGYILPHTGAIQGATAMAGIGPEGGVNIEAPLRRGMGLNEQEPYAAYRVSRMLGNMAADEPGMSQTALIAQELQRGVEMGDYRLEDALEGGREIERLAAEQGWSAGQLGMAQEMLSEAVRRAGMERGLGAVSSFVAGVPLRMEPTGEQRQIELEREQRGAQYSPLTGEGSREEMLAWRAEHPETVPRRMASSALPGAAEFEGWTPGDAWQSNEQRAQAAEINRTFDAAADALLQERPWDKAGAQELEEERRAELDVLRDGMGGRSGAAPVQGEAEAYRLRSVYGAGPEEEREIRQEEVLAAVSAALPRFSEFEDYEEYQQAVEVFFDDLASNMAGDERLAAIAGAMAEEVGGVDRTVAGGARRGAALPRLPVREERIVSAEELLAGVDREAIETYWRRNDSAMEALQRVYEDEVYSAAWDTYNQAVDRGMDKGEAWERYIEGAGTDAGRLVDAVMSAYPTKFTREELTEAYQGVEFPSVGEVNLLRKPEAEQELSRAQSGFWEFLNEQLPPGKLGSGAKEHTLVQLVLDGETRGTATAEQYQQALDWLQGWKASNFDREAWGTPADWVEARSRNDEFKSLAEKELPGIDETLARYYELGRAERTEFKKAHPEIGEYYDLRDWFGEQKENETWAWFYLGREYGVGSREGGSAGGWGGSSRKRYSKRSWGGGGGRYPRRAKDPDWAFGYQARRVPYNRLEAVDPFEDAENRKVHRYKYERWKKGRPWVVEKWRGR